MSRYFNDTQKSEEWFAEQGLGKRQDIASILQDLRTAKSNGDSPAEPGSDSLGAADRLAEPPQPHVDSPEAALIVPSPSVLTGDRAAHYSMEAYRALRTRLMRLQLSKGLQSFVMSSAMPGEGKTLTTINLGLCYSQLHGMPVLLIDADLRTRRLSQFLNRRRAPGLVEVLKGEASYEQVIHRTEHANLHVLTAGLSAGSPPELFSGTAWSGLLARCRERFKMILIDAPPVRPLADFELICASCDGFLMVVRARQTQREYLQQIGSQIDSKKLLGIVLNCMRPLSNDGYYGRYISNQA